MYKFSSLKLVNFFHVFLIVLILLFFHLSAPHSYAIQPTYGNWTFAGLSNSQISSLAVDPSNSNVLYTGTTNNGIFKSTDHGTNWSAVNSGLPSIQNLNVGGLAVDPSNSNVLYAGSNGSGGVFKSTDGGVTWIDITNGISNPLVTSIVIDPTNSNIIYVAASQVWKSTDGGATWVNTNAPFNPNIIVLDPTNPNIIYVGGGASISKTIDGGANWTATDPSTFGTNVAGSTGILTLTIDPNSPNILYTSVLPARAEPGVFKSIDGGVTWTLLSPNTFDSTSITGCNIYFLVSDPAISGTLYASGNSCPTFRNAPIYKSTDSGVTWHAINYSGLPWFQGSNSTVGILISKFDSNVLYGFPSSSSLGLYMYGLNPNSAPVVQMPGNSSINEGATYSVNGSFTDPDSTSWTAAVDYGDGSGSQSLTLSGMNFILSHVYTTPGTYTETVSITDNQGATGTGTATISVNPLYSVTGNVFNDANHNGVKDSGESNYQGATVTLSGASSASTTTDTNGNYTFSGLASGSYTVTLTDPTGYGSTTTNPVNLTLNSNTTENFGITTTTQVKLTPIVDTFVNANAPTTNYGTLDKLTVQGNPIKTAYLKYDLSSLAGKTITAVKFKITTYSDANSVTAGPDYVYLANSPTWGETTMTYNNQPGVSSTLLGTLSNMTSLNTQYSFPLDPSGIQSATGSRLSIGITTGTSDQLHIYSREATSAPNTPKLVIDYY